MGEEEIVIGQPTYDYEGRRWVVWESPFFARRATEMEIYRHKHGLNLPLIGWIHYDTDPCSATRYLRVGRGRWRAEFGEYGVYVRLGRYEITIALGRAE